MLNTVNLTENAFKLHFEPTQNSNASAILRRSWEITSIPSSSWKDDHIVSWWRGAFSQNFLNNQFNIILFPPSTIHQANFLGLWFWTFPCHRADTSMIHWKTKQQSGVLLGICPTIHNRHHHPNSIQHVSLSFYPRPKFIFPFFLRHSRSILG